MSLMTDQEKSIKYWKNSAIKDRKTANDLVKLKHNHWALFIWHLTIEKLLKGLLIKDKKEVVKTHNLYRLATELQPIRLPKKYLEWLKEITTFNLEARYDSYKFEFYQKATKAYTAKWGKRCEEIFQWLLKQY